MFKWPALGRVRQQHEALARGLSLPEDSVFELPPGLQAEVDLARTELASFTDFDVSELARVTGHPLKVVALAAFEHFGLNEELAVDVQKLCAYAEAIEGLYKCVGLTIG